MFVSFHLSRHPDKNSDPAAENRFVEINQAYEVRTCCYIQGFYKIAY
jgi:DnaJ-class molecular chaperone with C-terminal Zn finger domain